MINKLFLATLLLCVSISAASCTTGNTTPTAQMLQGVKLTKISQFDAAFEVTDLRSDRRNTQIIDQLVRYDLTSVLNQEAESKSSGRYKFIVEVLEYSTYFTAPQWNSRISLRIKIFSPNADLIGVIDPAAHAFRFNTWGLGSAEDAEREARRATATEFVRLTEPLLEGV
jgi:hypothetical protein